MSNVGGLPLKEWVECLDRTTIEHCNVCHYHNGQHRCPTCRVCYSPEQLATHLQELTIEEL